LNSSLICNGLLFIEEIWRASATIHPADPMTSQNYSQVTWITVGPLPP
jgi:hypothetical protein